MIRTRALLVALLLTAGTAHAQDARPFIRAVLAPHEGPAMVGEAVHVTVTVFSPTFFTGPAEWPDTLDMESAVARLDDGRAVNSNEHVGGESFAGISRDYLIYPLAPGTIVVPAIPIVVTYALDGAKPSPPTTLTSSPLSFEARLPAGADDVEHFVSASSLQLTEQFSRGLKGMKAGNAVTRTVTVSATDSWSAMLPDVETPPPIDGVSIYPKAPVLRDTSGDRGPRTSERIDAVSYVFAREGSFTLPAVSVTWWDQTGRRMRTARLPATTIDVAPAAVSAASTSIAFKDEEAEARAETARVAAERRRRERLVVEALASAAVLVVLVWVGRRTGPTIARLAANAWRRMRDSEPIYFSRALRASRAGDARASYRTALEWLDRVNRDADKPATLEHAVRGVPDAALAKEVAALQAVLFGRPDPNRNPWSGKRFSSLLWLVRRSLLDRTASGQGAPTVVLPPLNPAGRKPAEFA